MKRHLFIALIVCAVGSLPFPVHAQQPAIPVIGFLSSGSPDRYTIRLNAFQQGLKEAGYIESQNVTVEYRWAEGQNARLPTLAAELVLAGRHGKFSVANPPEAGDRLTPANVRFRG